MSKTVNEVRNSAIGGLTRLNSIRTRSNTKRDRSELLRAALVLAGVIVVCGNMVPAMAATKILDSRTQDVSSTATFGPFTVCGVYDTFTVTLRIGQSSFVAWDDGTSQFTMTGVQFKFLDSTGNLVASDQFNTLGITGTGSLPLTAQFNDIMTCAGGSATPGMFFNVHIGITIGEDGTLKEMPMVP